MKKIIFILLVFVFQESVACDICGCGVGNYNPHMFPHLSKSFLSLAYQHNYYQTHLTDNGVDMLNREYYNTIMFTGQYRFSKKIQVMMMVPFQVNKQLGEEGNKSFQRLGDIVLLANYNLWENYSKAGKYYISQSLLVGGGIKLPTGLHRYAEENGKDVPNPNFQAGTGSVDYLLNSSYALRYRNLAMNTGITYKINTSNKDSYRFGNRFLGLVQLKYIKDVKKISLIPNIGLMYENMQLDKRAGQRVDNTGGYTWKAIAGVDVNTRNIAVGFFLDQPVKQNLGEGNIKTFASVNAHISYSF